jgi:SAM-dependent methyltransferase
MDCTIFAPIVEGSAPRILDIGTGTGMWCVDMGDAYPTATIIGIDLRPAQHTWVPSNVLFSVDDAEDEWTFNYPFDVIHSRGMTGSVRNWPELLRQIYDNLRPGGWVEIYDFDIDFYSGDGSLKDEHALREWCIYSQKGAGESGMFATVWQTTWETDYRGRIRECLRN